MDILKANHSKSVDVFQFFDHYLRKKRFVLIYLPYKELLDYGITFEKNIYKQTDIARYSLKTRKKTKTIKIIF